MDSDVNDDLFQLTVWKQGSDNRMVLDDNRMVLDDWDVDLGQITVWGQGNDTDGFGHGLHKQFPQLLSGKGICFGISCSFLGVLPSGLLKLFLPDSVLFLPDSTLALSGLEKLSVTPLLGFLEVVLGLS